MGSTHLPPEWLLRHAGGLNGAASWNDGTEPIYAGHWPEPPTSEPQTAWLTLSAEPRSGRQARDFTHKRLADWGLDDLTDDAASVMVELLTNAITHAIPHQQRGEPPQLQVILIRDRHSVAVVVTDPADDPPILVPADESLFPESGRGLHIVAVLSRRWGWASLGNGGKAVWAVLDNPAQPSQ